MANKTLTVRAPYGGIYRRASFQQQAPFTSYDSLNYLPIDVKTGRITTAVRPPLTLFGSLETTANMLSIVNGISSGLPAKSFAAAYAGQLYYWNGSTMVAATGAQAGSIDTNQYVSAAPVVNQLVITKSGAAPIVFDYPTKAAATLVASAGTVPTGATIAVSWQGALWLVKDSVLYASRVGDITDWDYSAVLTDLYGAFYTDGDYKGVLAGPVTAVMPQTSDLMVVSTVSGSLAMRGHPRQGGVFEPISSSYVLGQGAWCQIPDGTLLMLTPQGIMSLAPNPGAVMAPVSREKIPDELNGVLYDRDDPLVNMVYDTRWNGVHIYIRGAQEQGWWFDLSTGGFHRLEIGAYPYALMEFSDFVTESTSGVLLGRYNGIYEYDRFATETINASIVAGPVKISASPLHASKIKAVRVTFARDTPTGTGSLKIAAGIDGQDAVNRLLNGKHQYSIPMTALESSYGMCYPDVTGHAAVFALTTQTGDLAVEEIVADVKQMGRLTMNRGEQIAVSGEVSEFSGAFIDLDTSIWAGYSLATPGIAPDEQLPDYTHFVDLSLMPTSWWDEVQGPNGEDIRVSDTVDNQVPSTLIDFSLSGRTGMLAFKITQPTSKRKVRVWVGNPNAATPTADSTYGQYNVYDDNWRGFWPDAGGTSNQTQYGNNTATTNYENGSASALAYGTQDGPMGAKATDYRTTGVTYWGIDGWHTSQSLTTQAAWTLVAAWRRKSGELTFAQNLINFREASGFHEQNIRASVNHTGLVEAYTEATSDGGTAYVASSSYGSAADDTWRHHAGVFVSDDERSAYIDGTGKGTDSNTVALTPTKLYFGSTNGGDSVAGDMAMLQIHDTARSDAWVKYQGDMMDQVTFWGTIGEFTLVNTSTPDSLITAACPSGYVSQTETGTTAGYALLTPVDPSDGTVNKFSHLIDLSILPASWWSAAVSAGLSGADIRATDTSNNLLPFDLIAYDESASTGLAVVRQSQAEGNPTGIRLWVGNSGAITINNCNAYGRFSAYDADWRGFWPTGGGTDRTQYANDLTQVGTSTVALGSQVGGDSTDYANITVTEAYASTTVNLPTENPLTLTASVKKPSGSVHTDSVIMALQSTDDAPGVFLHTRPSTTPARLTTRNAFGTEATAGNSATITPTSWWYQSGTSYGNHTRLCYVGDGSGSSSSNQSTIIVSGLGRLTIGAEHSGGTPIRGMNAELALLGLHAAARGTAWNSYWYKSLTQATFWTVGSWTADPTALS